MKTVNITMPQMGQSAAEGTIVRWNKNVGDQVEVDEVLVEVESDKISFEVESPVKGTVTQCSEVGMTVPVGEVIAAISPDTEAPVAGNPPAGADAPPEAETQSAASDKPHAANSEEDQILVSTADMPTRIDVPDLPDSTRDWLSPSVMRLALLNNVTASNLKTIQGSGRRGRITREDVLAYIGRRSSKSASLTETTVPPPSDDVEVVPMTTIRRTIADHMVQSIHTSPHVTMVHSVDMTNLVELRQRVNQAFLEKYGIKLGYTAALLHATSRVLPNFPTINGSVSGTNILRFNRYNIGCAVALPDESLVVPVVKDANLKSFPEISVDFDRLIKLARDRSLTRDDIEGGTFTISNFGSFGSLIGTPIINQPQVAILGMGAVFEAPVVVNGKVEVRNTMYLSLSFDHRVIDGAMGGRFLNQIQKFVENLSPDDLDVTDLV